MISFIDKQFDKNNFKVWLYTPGNQFLGELVVDKPVLNLQLEGLNSTFSFTLPENIETALIVDENANQATIESVVNPRINETLDQFQVEVWYGDLETDSFQKQRFVIIETPRQWNNDITNFTYKAYSKEYENVFVKVIDWPGVQITEFVDQRNRVNASGANETFNLARTPKDQRLIRVEIVKDFIYRLVQLTASAEGYQFGSLQPRVDTIKVYKFIEAGDQRLLLTKDQHYEIREDEFTGLKRIVYNINSTFGGITLEDNDNIFIEYKLEDPVKLDLVRSDSSSIIDEYNFFYDENNNRITCYVPPVPKVFQPLGVRFYENAPTGSEIQVKIFYETTTALNPQDPVNKIFVKDGLRIEQVFESLLAYGDEDSNAGKWSATFVASSDELRSNFAFNNTNLLSAIEQTLKTYDAIALPDTINKVFYIYDKLTANTVTQTVTENGQTKEVLVSSYRQDTGLSFEYGKFLRSVSQDINAKDIVTVMRGLGTDNITAAPSSLTGYNEWEDYTWFLDGAFITNREAVLIQGEDIILNKVSRWMSKSLTEKLLLWMEARDALYKDYYEVTPGSLFNQYSTNGLIFAADEIGRRIANKRAELITLSLALTQAETTLNVFMDTENKSYVENWTGDYKGNSYTGESGYETYLTLKYDDTLAAYEAKKVEVGALEDDLLSIQSRLEEDWADIAKTEFGEHFFAADLSRYNFTSADLTELQAFRREGVYENRFITKPSELFLEMQKEIVSKRIPRVEIRADIIGLLQTTEARTEWNKLRLGGLANLVLGRLNIDIQIQIKEITLDIDNNSTSITFSTTKDYIGIGQKNLGRFLSNAAYNLKNNVGYYEDQWNTGAEEAKDSFTKINEGYEVNNLNTIEAGGLTIGGNGGELSSCVVNPLDDEVVCTNKSDIARLLVFGFVRIDRGMIDVFNRDQTGAIINQVRIRPEGVTQESSRSIVRMDDEGFAIFGKVNGNLQKQFFVDENGNIVFAGTISQTVYDDLNIRPILIDASGYNIIIDTDGGNPTPSSVTLTATLAQGFTTFNWQYNSGGTWINFNNTTDTITIAHDNVAWGGELLLLIRCVTNGGAFDEATLYKVTRGGDGDDGQPGLAGPGVAYRGRWNNTTQYISTDTVPTRRDIVDYSDANGVPINSSMRFWISTRTQTGGAPPSSGTTANINWEAFGAVFSSIATGLLFTENATIGRGLIVGTEGSFNGFIRSAGANNASADNTAVPVTLGAGQQGFILRTDGQMIVGNDQSYMRWRGSTLDVVGDIGGQVGSITLGNITLDETGITGKDSGGITRFFLNASTGAGEFTGKITADSGNIAGWNISPTRLAVPNNVGDIEVFNTNITIWSGPQANSGAAFPSIVGTKFGFTNAAWGFYRRNDVFPNSSVESLTASKNGFVYNSIGTTGGNTQNFIIDSNKRLTLRAALGTDETAGIYVRGRELNVDTLLRNPNGTGNFDGATEVSSAVVKKDIENLNISTVNQFMETLDIKQFKYKETGEMGISLIIEDEQADNIPYQEALFAKIQGQLIYDTWEEVPDWLKEYENTPTLTEREDGKYSFNPKMYNPNVLLALTVAFVKEQSQKVKSLEERILALEEK